MESVALIVRLITMIFPLPYCPDGVYGCSPFMLTHSRTNFALSLFYQHLFSLFLYTGMIVLISGMVIVFWDRRKIRNHDT